MQVGLILNYSTCTIIQQPALFTACSLGCPRLCLRIGVAVLLHPQPLSNITVRLSTFSTGPTLPTCPQRPLGHFLYMPACLKDSSPSDMDWVFVSFKYLLKCYLCNEARFTVALSPPGVHVLLLWYYTDLYYSSCLMT